MCLESGEQCGAGAVGSGEEFRCCSEGSGSYREVLNRKGGAWSDSESSQASKEARHVTWQLEYSVGIPSFFHSFIHSTITLSAGILPGTAVNTLWGSKEAMGGSPKKRPSDPTVG